MAHVRGGSLVIANRPKRYKVSGTDFSAGGHGGFYAKMRPAPYPKTAQQSRVAKAAEDCGIKAGMSRAELVKAMHQCIPGKFGK